MQTLRVAQSDVADGIARRGDLFVHQADDRESVPVRAERHFLAELKAGGAVDDHLIVVAQDFAAGQQFVGAAGPPGSKPMRNSRSGLPLSSVCTD